MLENFQLAAIVKQGAQRRLLQVPLHQVLQDTLAEAWEEQYADFVDELQEIDFDIGYRPDGQECFALPDYELPPWLADEDSETVPDLEAVNDHEQAFGSIAGIVAFAQDARAEELVLFQNFTRSRVIRPGQFLFLRQDTYESAERPGLTLDHGLTAVYHPTDSKLLFRNFRWRPMMNNASALGPDPAPDLTGSRRSEKTSPRRAMPNRAWPSRGCVPGGVGSGRVRSAGDPTPTRGRGASQGDRAVGAFIHGAPPPTASPTSRRIG